MRRLEAVCVTIACLILSSVSVWSQPPPTLTTLYDTIKAQASGLALPKPKDTVTVGTADVVTHTFNYSPWPEIKDRVVTRTGGNGGRVISGPGEGTPANEGRPEDTETVTVGAVVTTVNVYDLTLRFKVSHRVGVLAVAVPGLGSASAPAGQNYVDIDVGTNSPTSFILTTGSGTFSGELSIKRVISGVGAVTIPALPITILYAPPVDQQKKNVASFTATNVTGNTTTVSSLDQSSNTVPVASDFRVTRWTDLASEMKYASTALSQVKGNEYAQIIGGVLGVLSGLLGSTTATGTVATSILNQQSLTVTLTGMDMVSTNPNDGGPGKGDVIYYLHNARVCWYANGGPIQLALLGWDSQATVTVSTLQAGTAPTGLDEATRTALLSLDPFVATGATTRPPAPRFVRLDTYEINAPHTFNQTYSLTNQDLQQSAYMEANMEDDTASLFAFAGIGVATTDKWQGSLTQTSAAQTTTTTTLSRQLQFYANPGEFYIVEVYCDVVFGTFAFRSIPAATTPFAHGRILNKAGNLMPNTEVTLVVHGHRYHTVTDANGEYTFRANTIKPGAGRISSLAKTLDVEADTPLKNADLKLEH